MSWGAVALAIAVIAAWLGWRRCVRWLDANQRADWGAPWLNRLDGLNRIFCRAYHALRADPVPLPETGPAVLVSNHVSGLDPLLLAAACERPLRFVIAEEQYDRWWLRWFFDAIRVIPVDREDRPERSFYAARKALAAGEVVAIFPEGGIGAGKAPPRLKRGALMLARGAAAPLVPVRLSGIGGAGRTLAAVLVRSRARLESGPVIASTAPRHDSAEAALATFLRG